MKLKVNYNELRDIGSFVYKKSEELESNLKSVLKIIDSVDKYWTGIDATNFKINSSVYVNNMGIKVSELKNISTFLKNTSDKYENKDLSFERNVKKEGLANEKY